MRVIFISGFADFIGGGEHSLFDLITHLPEEIEPILLLPGEGGLSRKAKDEGLHYRCISMPPIGLRSFPALLRWYRMLRMERPDILHANNSRAAVYAAIVGRLLKIPVIFHCRVSWRDNKLDRFLEWMCTLIIANSQATANRFRSSSHVRVVYNGVDVSWYPAQRETGDKPFGAEAILLNVARVSRWKRHDVLLEVFDALSERLPGLHLVCIGEEDKNDPGWWDELQRHTLQLLAPDRVHWLGGLSKTEMATWFSAADVFALPSRNEPFGRVLVEAMNAGLPVVAFALGGPVELVQDGRQGMLVKEGDVRSFADAVEKILCDESLAREMAAQGMSTAKKYSVESHVKSMMDVYRELIA